MLNLVGLFIKWEPVIDRLVPRSRRANNNRMCSSVVMGRDRDSALDALVQLGAVSYMRRMGNGRYKKLNLESFGRHGTIEVRQHSGTTESDKIIQWVILTQALVTQAKSMRTRIRRKAGRPTLNCFFARIGWNGSSDDLVQWARNFTVSRFKVFNPDTKVSQPVSAFVS